ncbi:MAG: acetylxylan esterase [Planctomycetes bacterium]|nr:acetylxylan esterase [Planctomycetota bacterium]
MRIRIALLAGLLGPLLVTAKEPVPPVCLRLNADVKAAQLAMRFKGNTAAECQDWQKHFAAKVKELLGVHAPPKRWRASVVTSELDDHWRMDMQMTADGYPPLPVYLLVPKGKKGKRPAILAIHGHGAHGHHPVAGRDDLPGVAKAIKNSNYDYGRQLVRLGYVVAVPCLTPFGDRLGKREAFGKQDPCADVFIRMSILGKTLMGENLRDCLWALELLAQHEAVDPGRIGCVGLSYGGRMTMLTAALEPRVKVCVISGALNAMQERVSRPYSCGAQIIPGLLKFGDVPEIASLIAPRECVWEVGARDGLIDATWAEEILRRQRRAYKALGVEGRVIVDRFDGGHVWHGTTGVKVLGKILRP